MDTAVSIVAISATWVFTAFVLVGCGFSVRLVLARIVLGERVGTPAVPDFWIGLAALVAYLQAWSFFLRTSGYTWLVPLATAVVAAIVVIWRRAPTSISWSRTYGAILGFAGLGLLWVADRSLGPAENYDSGLYHTGVVEYASRFHVIPGLGNLHGRFGNSDSHLLFVAYLDQGPWPGAGIQIANGLFLGALLIDVCLRFVVRREGALTSFTDRLAILLVPAAATIVAWRPDSRISSPELDVSTFVFVFVGALYLGELVERGFATAPALASVGGFAAAATTRALYWVPAFLSIGIIVACARRHDNDRSRLARVTVFVGALPAALATGWLGRQAILSGYPLLPLKMGALPVDWRMPAATVDVNNSWARSWAREPGVAPDVVLANWHWLGSWLRMRLTKETDVIVPLAVLACTLPWAVLACDDRDRAGRKRPMLAVLGVSLVTLLFWFVEAPEPRFAFAPIWLVPLALAAWAVPRIARDAFVPAAAAAIAAAVLLSALAAYALALFLPAATIVWVTAGIVVFLTGLTRTHAWVATSAVGSVLLAGLAISAGHGHALRLLHASRQGPLGTVGVPNPRVVPFVTTSGLRLKRPVPVGREFRCWRLILCTAYPSRALRVRGDDLASGFSVQPP